MIEKPKLREDLACSPEDKQVVVFHRLIKVDF